MKTLINKPVRSDKLVKAEKKRHLFMFTCPTELTSESHCENYYLSFGRAFIFFLLSFIFSASAMFPQKSNAKNDDIKWLDILEKLESGKEIPPLPKISSFPGQYFYQYHDRRGHVIISDKDILEIHKQLDNSLEELRKDIESFRNSEDFIIMHDELQKWNDNFRLELEKMREELIRSENRTRNKGSVQTIIL